MKICIFGAGRYGYEAYDIISCKWNKAHIIFCDNYMKEKESINGIRIINFEELQMMLKKENMVIIIATIHFREIYEQCKKAKIEITGVYDIHSNSIVSYKTAILNEGKKSGENKLNNYFMKYGQYIVLRNIFHTNFMKKCLILYIINPFFVMDNAHTNQSLAHVIAKVFCENGYDVDVAGYDTRVKVDFEKYDLVFGFGHQFDRALEISTGTSLKTIAFLTGAFPYYSNLAELKRQKNFEKRNGVKLKLRRQCGFAGGLMNLEVLQNASTALCIGNDWTCKTYGEVFNNVYRITATGFASVKLCDIQRNIETAKRNFLWFAGSGNLHKGLDLCIEAFRAIPEINLYVAGLLDDDFYDFYQADFSERKNIHYLRFVNVNSAQYKYLCEKCLFNILPSCSEGSASSVLTTMFSGMIPVVTEQTGVDIGDFGFQISDIQVDALTNLIKKLCLLSNDELKNREKKAYKWAVKNHTLKRFKKDLSKIVQNI